MGRYFEENYAMLKRKLVEMAGLVQETVKWTIEILRTGDEALIQRVVRDEDEVDRLEIEIDELVLKLLALQQPMAIDLRFLITALKINNDLERMGDQAVNIAKNVSRLKTIGINNFRNLVELTKMEDSVAKMVDDMIRAFTVGDVELAKQVIADDDQVDELNKQIITTLVDHLRDHTGDADACITLLLITRNLERIGDLSTNIAEDVIYYIDGKIIRHGY